MAGALLRQIRKAAGRMGVTVGRHTSSSEQKALLAMLWPVATEHALMRVGSEGDGGYLVPDDLAGIEACFSPGVNAIATFESDLIERGIRTFQIDASVADTPLHHPLNDFDRKFLGIETRGDFITLDDWVARKLPRSDGELILQMDIEGHEWLTLANVSERTLRRFRIIVLELHDLQRIFDGVGAWVFRPVLARLLHHYDVVHLHANNVAPLEWSRNVAVAPFTEVTLLRKDRSTRRTRVASLPHALDRDNVPGKPSIAVPSGAAG